MKSRLLWTMYINGLRGLHPVAPVLIVLFASIGALFPVVSCASLVSAVLPTSRSVQVGDTATAFATIINAGPGTATGCLINPVTTVPATFLYQTTDPATNALTGTPNTPIDIAEGAAQTFLFAFTPTAPFAPTEVELSFDCTNTSPAASVNGLNTLLLSGSSTPVPDIIALATGTGILDLPASANGAGAFAVATVNVGSTGTITAKADTGSVSLPVTLSVCETNPSTGACINPSSPAATATTTITAGSTPTFAFFATATGPIPLDLANNRAFVSFTDGGGIVRGSTSTALSSNIGTTAEGLWVGTTSNGRDITGLVLDDGTYWFLYGNNAVIAGAAQGNGTYNNGSFTSTNGKDYNLEGLGILNFTLDSSYVEKKSFNGTLTYTATGDQVTFTSSYDAGYDLTPSLNDIAGTYSGSAATTGGADFTTVSITSTGILTGTSASGCNFSGTASTRANGNVYNVSVTFKGGVCANGTSTVIGVAYYDAAINQLSSAALNNTRTNGFIFTGTKP